MPDDYKSLPAGEVVSMLASIRQIVERDLPLETARHGSATPQFDCPGCTDLLLALYQLRRLYRAGWVAGPAKEALAAGWSAANLSEALHYAARRSNS